MVRGEGRSPETAALLLTIMVLAAIAAGPLVGTFVGHRPDLRPAIVIGVVTATVVVWTVVLIWPGRTPLWLLVVLVVVLAASGPGSMIGFDLARTSNSPRQLGIATGMVNVGGFLATIITILAIGLLLEVTSFEGAFTAQYLVWTIGGWRFLHHLRRIDGGRSG